MLRPPQGKLLPIAGWMAAVAMAVAAVAAENLDAEAVLKRMDQAVPPAAHIKANWRFEQAPQQVKVEARLEAMRRQSIRRGDRPKMTGQLVGQERKLLERDRKGYVLSDRMEYFWAPGMKRVERESTDPVSGKLLRVGSFYVHGATYRLSRDLGTGEVRPGQQVVSGSATEILYLYGQRLGDQLVSDSLQLTRDGGRLVLEGTIRQPPGGKYIAPPGSAIRISTSPAAGYLPEELEIRRPDGSLYEKATLSRFKKWGGNVLYPQRVEVSRFQLGTPVITWRIEIQSLTTAVKSADFAPASPRPIRIFDARLNPGDGTGPTVPYTLQPGDPFPHLAQLSRLRRPNKLPAATWLASPRLLIRLAGLLLIVLSVVILTRRAMRRTPPRSNSRGNH